MKGGRSVVFLREVCRGWEDDIGAGAAGAEQLAEGDDIDVRRSGASARHEQECGQKSFTETMHSSSGSSRALPFYDYAVE